MLAPMSRYYGLTVPQARAVFRQLAPNMERFFFDVKSSTREYYRTDDEMRSYAFNVFYETVRALHRTRECGKIRELHKRGGDAGACVARVMKQHSRSYQVLKKNLRKSELEQVEREVVKILGKTLFAVADPLASKRVITRDAERRLTRCRWCTWPSRRPQPSSWRGRTTPSIPVQNRGCRLRTESPAPYRGTSPRSGCASPLPVG